MNFKLQNIGIATFPTIFTINANNEPIIKIHTNGKIEYTGEPDEAAKLFLNSINISINEKHLSERIALERLYTEVHAIIDRIDGMTKNEIITYFQEIESNTHKSLTWAILNEKRKIE